MSMISTTPSNHGTLRDWARHNPRQIGFLRLGLLVVVLSLMGICGAILGNSVSTPAPDVPLSQQPAWPVTIGYYLLPALLGIAFTLWRANGFLVKAFHLPTPSSGLAHVMAIMFGIGSAPLYVQQGKLDFDNSDKAARIIGGPALLVVSEASAVLLERGAGFSRIVGTGVHRLRPHERVRGTVDLRTQRGEVHDKLLTKDGIPVKVDVDLVFRMSEKDIPNDSPLTPPPPLGPFTRLRQHLRLRVRHDLVETSRPHRFSREAVRRIVYETSVASPEVQPDWAASFPGMRAGDITDRIAERLLDEISAPEDPLVHPRAEIVKSGLEAARKSPATNHIELLHMSMGVIEPQDKYPHIKAQMISNWKIEWERRAKNLQAKAEAKRAQLLEEARAEAQANMIQALTDSYRVAVSNNPQASKQVIALRFIDTLESLLAEKFPENSTDTDMLTQLRQLRG